MWVHTGLNATTSFFGPTPPPAGTPSLTSMFLNSLVGYSNVTGTSCFRALNFPIFVRGYSETTASTSLVPKPGSPRKIVAVAIPPLNRNCLLERRHFVKHPSFFSVFRSSIKIHLPHYERQEASYRVLTPALCLPFLTLFLWLPVSHRRIIRHLRHGQPDLLPAECQEKIYKGALFFLCQIQ